MFILEADPVSISLLNTHAEAQRATNQIAWVSMFLIFQNVFYMLQSFY